MKLNRIWRSLGITMVLAAALLTTAVLFSQGATAAPSGDRLEQEMATVVTGTRFIGTIDAFGIHVYDVTIFDPRPIPAGPGVKYELNDVNNTGVQAIFFTNDQFLTWANSGKRPDSPDIQKILGAPSSAAGAPQNVDLIMVNDPPTEGYIVVFGSSVAGAPYEIMVAEMNGTTNGFLADESAQSTTAQEAQSDDRDVTAPAEEVDEEPAETPAETTTVATTTTTAETTTEVTADTTATETVAPIAPTVISTTTLIGVLDDPFQTHIFQFDVYDPRPRLSSASSAPGVKIELIDVNNSGVQAIVFTTDQFQTWATSLVPPDASMTRSGTPLDKIVLGPDSKGPVNVDIAEIQQPADMFLVVVYNGREPGSPYELRVKEMNGVVNGVLYDESAQSTTAQEMQPAVVPVAETEDDAEETTTEAPASAAPAARTITPGGTYTVRAGDTLGTIALGAYGNTAYYISIGAANPEITNLNVIEVGQVLNIPTQAEADRLLAAADTDSANTTTVVEATPTPVPAAAGTAPTATPTPVPAAGAAPTATPTTAPAAAAPTATPTAAAGASAGTIIEVATSSRQFEILLLALDLAELTGSLLEAGPFTVFAPTDAAFATLPEATLDSLLAEPAELARVLQFHVVPGRFTSADLTDGATLTTLLGDALTISIDGSGNTLVNGARIVNQDFNASNGVVHGIDSVLLP